MRVLPPYHHAPHWLSKNLGIYSIFKNKYQKLMVIIVIKTIFKQVIKQSETTELQIPITTYKKF